MKPLYFYKYLDVFQSQREYNMGTLLSQSSGNILSEQIGPLNRPIRIIRLWDLTSWIIRGRGASDIYNLLFLTMKFIGYLH